MSPRGVTCHEERGGAREAQEASGIDDGGESEGNAGMDAKQTHRTCPKETDAPAGVQEELGINDQSGSEGNGGGNTARAPKKSGFTHPPGRLGAQGDHKDGRLAPHGETVPLTSSGTRMASIAQVSGSIQQRFEKVSRQGFRIGDRGRAGT